MRNKTIELATKNKIKFNSTSFMATRLYLLTMLNQKSLKFLEVQTKLKLLNWKKI